METTLEGRPATPANAERETPAWLFALLDEEFRFTLDAAAAPGNAKCARWLGRQADGSFLDGLTEPWRNADGTPAIAFCNPPYSRGQLRRWLAKAHAERERGATAVLLIPGDRSTRAWQRYVPGEEVRDLCERVDYGVGAGAKFASAIVVLRPPVAPFTLPWVVTPAAAVRAAEAELWRERDRALVRMAAAEIKLERAEAAVARLRARLAARRKPAPKAKTLAEVFAAEAEGL